MKEVSILRWHGSFSVSSKIYLVMSSMTLLIAFEFHTLLGFLQYTFLRKSFCGNRKQPGSEYPDLYPGLYSKTNHDKRK